MGDKLASATPAPLGYDSLPTLRQAVAGGHNGYAKSLKQLVRFYNTRDVMEFAMDVTSGDCPRKGWTAGPGPRSRTTWT
jgi:cytochrome c peroxidase